jgi:hypothetical protein
MKELKLDGAGWSTKHDVYNAFFRAVGASEWEELECSQCQDCEWLNQ